VALVCGLGFLLAREQDFVESALRAGWLLGAWRAIAKIPVDVVLVCFEALRQTVRPKRRRGVFRAVPFGAVAQTPQDTGRRSLAEAFGSLAPNTIVVGVDAERKLLLVHQLRRDGAGGELDVLRLG